MIDNFILRINMKKNKLLIIIKILFYIIHSFLSLYFPFIQIKKVKFLYFFSLYFPFTIVIKKKKYIVLNN